MFGRPPRSRPRLPRPHYPAAPRLARLHEQAKAAAKAQARAKAQVPTGATEQHPGLPRMPPTMPIVTDADVADAFRLRGEIPFLLFVIDLLPLESENDEISKNRNHKEAFG